ncbi:MAG: DUF5131 family protein [Eubacteriaceae bacterium]|jgi:protein gp37
MQTWNPWHGCFKISAGCKNCYMYASDLRYDRNPQDIHRTASFDLPARKKRSGSWSFCPGGGSVFCCGTSDFFLKEADPWREEAWNMIRNRPDLDFLIVTKRIHRAAETFPPDWGNGWENVRICSTCENQETADFRIPILLDLPIRHRIIAHEPMLEAIRIEDLIGGRAGLIENVNCGGESGEYARLCRYDWVLDTREQCRRLGISYTFRQTGARFEKDGRLYRIPRRLQGSQARKAGIDLY